MTAQAPRLDVITENVGENVRRVQARDLGATVVQALFRLVKQSTLHSLDNQAVVRQVEDAAHIINDYGQRTDQNVSLLFAFGSIFVGGSLLKANRQVYEGATELGEILKKYGFSELAIARNVTPQDLFAFVAAMGEAHRSGRSANMEKPSARIRLRAVAESALRRGATVERLDEHQAVIRMYASAIVIMRRFFEQLQNHALPIDVRVLRALSNSARRLDLLFWVTYRITRLQTRLVLDWAPLKGQFGEGYARDRDFRSALNEDVSALKELFPKLPLRLTERGLEMDPTDPAVLAIPKRALRG